MTTPLSTDYRRISKEIFDLVKHKPVVGLLIITGKNIYSSLRLGELVEELSLVIPTELWLDDSKTPNSSMLKRICSFVDSHPNRQIIGIGGGRVMDYAKLIASYQAGDDFGDLGLLRPNCDSTSVLTSSNALLIPTVFRSGAESTRHAVLYHEGVKRSHSISENVALESVLFVELAATAGTINRLDAGLDAVCQAVESTLSKLATRREINDNLLSLRSLLENFDSYCQFDSLEKVNEFAENARLVGDAMNTTKTVAPHAASYYLTHDMGIPHGLAVAFTAPEFFNHLIDWSSGSNDDSLGPVLKSINEVFATAGKESFPIFLNNVLMENLEIIHGFLRAFAVQTDLDKWISLIDQSRLANHPIFLNNVVLHTILAAAHSERMKILSPLA